MGQRGRAGEVCCATDPVLITAASCTWPLEVAEGFHVGALVPATSGQIIVYAADPLSRSSGGGGGGEWTRLIRNRRMRWCVSEF